MIALTLLAQGGLGALAAVHELLEHPESIVVHAEHMQPHEHTANADDSHETVSLVHILLHQAHCGSHTAALYLGVMELPPPAGAAATTRDEPTCQVFAAHSAALFRPPRIA